MKTIEEVVKEQREARKELWSITIYLNKRPIGSAQVWGMDQVDAMKQLEKLIEFKGNKQ